MTVKRISGRIAYRAPDGAETGRERFDLVTHDGGHMLRAWCEIDEGLLLRDVSIAMDADWRPVDGFLRLTGGGAPAATLMFDVRADAVIASGSIGGMPMAPQRIATGGRLRYLGLHPLQGDALIVQARGTSRPGTFETIAAVTNSISPNGDEAPGAMPVAIDVAYVGEEEVAVAAGRFAARRYRLRWREDWAAADLWVGRDDALFLKMTWAQVPTWYELTEWETA